MAGSTFDNTFSRHYSALVVWARRYIPRGLGEAEDFVHGAYLRCRYTWQADRQSVRCEVSYFRRSIRWLMLDAVRQKRRGAQHGRQYAELKPMCDLPSLATIVLDDALAGLPPRQRQLGRALVAGKSLRQVQEELDLSAEAVAVAASRLRCALKRCIH